MCYCISTLDYGQYILLSIEKVRRCFSQHKWPHVRRRIIRYVDGRQHSYITEESFRIITVWQSAFPSAQRLSSPTVPDDCKAI